MQPFASLGYRGQVGRLRRLASAALREYELEVRQLALLAHLENTTFRVVDRDGHRHALRVYRVIGSPFHPPRSLAEVRSEVAWLAALRRDTDLVVPEPVPRRDGELVTVVGVEGVPEPRTCVLFRWVDGRFVDRGLTPGHLERVGRFTARLHRHARSFSLPTGFERRPVVAVSGEVRDWAVAAVTETIGADAVPGVEAAIELAGEAQRRLGRNPGAFGLIHADLHQENYLFHAGEVRAIDFDDCGMGCYLFDLAVTQSEISWRPGYEPMREALLRGYRSMLPLPEEHEPLVDMFEAFRLLQLALWFIEQRHHPGFPDWEAEARQLMAEVRTRVSS